MKNLVKLTVLILFTFIINLQKTIAQCHIDDWTALKALYDSTNGDNWNNRTGWDTQIANYSSPPVNCNLENLYGVYLDVNNRVRCLDLDGNPICGNNPFAGGNNLSGTIPVEINKLNNLTKLYLSNNQLNGSIPSELGNLSNLMGLWLHTNQLSGSIPPELGNLNDLIFMNLQNNQLNGSIPKEFGNLVNLTELRLYSNQLSGQIPKEFGNLSNLIGLKLYSNKLNGNIPPELGNLSNLRELNAYDNELSGNIPPELGNLGNLIGFRLFSNQLNGSLPNELGNLNNMTLFEVSFNNLSGCYPSNFSNFCTQLTNDLFDGNSDISTDNNFFATWEDFCATGVGTCTQIDPPTTTNVWPGDINYDGFVNNADRSSHYLFFGEIGMPRAQQGINWQPYQTADWGIPQPNGNDIKHFDCDGNGFINSQDQNAIILNWGNQHQEAFTSPDVPNSFGFGLFGTDYQIYLRLTNQVSNPLIMDVVLESVDGNNLNLFGGYFTIDYDNVNANVTNAVMNFSNSWLGIPNIDLMGDYKNFPNDKKIEIAFSKTNGVASLGNGIIGQVAFQIDNSNFKLNPANSLVVDFDVNQIGAHDVEGNLLPIEDQQYSVNIGNTTCPINLTINGSSPFQNIYKSNSTITTDSLVIIGQNQQVEYRSNHITLTEGFNARAGSQFKIRHGGCN